MKQNQSKNVFIIKILVIVSGLILEISGIAMIFLDLHTQGSIQIKTAIFEGYIHATYIGIFVIFLGIILQTVAILKKYRIKENPKSIKTKNYEYFSGGGEEDCEE